MSCITFGTPSTTGSRHRLWRSQGLASKEFGAIGRRLTHQAVQGVRVHFC